MSLKFGLGRDTAGRPRFSASFVLAHAPAPGERLRDLVTHAVVAADLVATDDDATLTRTRVTVELPDGPVRAVGSGPFGQVSVAVTVEGPDAGTLLQSLVQRHGGPTIRVEAMTTPGPAAPRQVRIRLGRLWDVLDAHAGATRIFHRADLERHLDDLVGQGAVALAGVPATAATRAAVTDVVLRRAVGVLAPIVATDLAVVTAGRPLSPDYPPAVVADPPAIVSNQPAESGGYLLANHRPGDVEVTAMTTLPGAPGPILTAERSLGTLLADAGADPASYLSLVTVDGGQVSGLVPSRALTKGKAGPGERMVMLQSADRVQPVLLAAGGTLAPAVRPTAIRLNTQVAVADAVTVAMFAPDQAGSPGPVVDQDGPAFWRDRFNATTFWYVPELTLVRPGPAQPADTAPYRFDVTPTGHALDGTDGLEATITVTFASRMPDDVRAAWEAAGSPTARPIVGQPLQVQLGVPFRDENGNPQVQYHLAESATPSVDFGADGGTLVVVFRLADQWARMAYGALSSPGFQAEPARVLITSTYDGWRRLGGFFPIAQPDKIAVVLKPPIDRLAVLRPSVVRRPRLTVAVEPVEPVPPRWEVGIAAAQVNVLAKAGITVEPRLHMNAALIAGLYRDRYEWARFSSVTSASVLVPCADHGNLYRRVVAGEAPVAVGCQEVLKLGQAAFRTYELITVAAAQGHAKVLRSLTRPGHFVLVPDRYRVGRFGAEAEDRAYQPQLLLTSVLDLDTAALRAVLATTIEADVAPAIRTAVVDELRSRSPEVILDLPWAAGLAQTVTLAVPGAGEVQCVPTPTGFTVVLTLDVSDFLVAKTMLETVGLAGGATLTLPDGLTVASTVRLCLSEVTGPYDGGPVSRLRAGDELGLTNRIRSRVAVTKLRAPGGAEVDVDLVLGAGESTAVSAPRPPDGEYDVVSVMESSHDTLEEVRVYVEDLEVEVVFVLTGNLGALAALEVATTFLGRTDPAPIVLTGTHRQEARRYLLPLTAYVADPALQYVCTTVATDGTRTAGAAVEWALRRQGAVIPVSLPPTSD